MHDDAIYVNGVFDSVLREIVAIQTAVPEQILFMQPFSDARISMLANKPPTIEDPVRLYVSISEDLGHVHYVGEVIGWENKRTIGSARKAIFERLIKEFQPGERNLSAKGVHVIVVRSMAKLDTPFPVGHLIVRSKMAPLRQRSTAGGWAFVLHDPVGVNLPWPWHK